MPATTKMPSTRLIDGADRLRTADGHSLNEQAIPLRGKGFRLIHEIHSAGHPPVVDDMSA